MKLLDRKAQWLKMAAETDEKALDPAVRTALRCCAHQLEADVREQAGEWEGREFIETPLGETHHQCARDLLATTEGGE